jgi:hypothetical protein
LRTGQIGSDVRWRAPEHVARLVADRFDAAIHLIERDD